MTDFEMLLEKTNEMGGKISYLEYNECYSLCECVIKYVRLYWIFDDNNVRVYATVDIDKAYAAYVRMTKYRRYRNDHTKQQNCLTEGGTA